MSKLLKTLRQADKLVGIQRFNIREVLFDKQVELVTDPSRYKVATCGRRAGKTTACAVDLFDTALKYPGMNILYVTLNRISGKRIIWKELLRLNKEYSIGAHENVGDLTFTFDNGSTIYVSGAKDASEVEKYRGMHLKLVYIDECQSFRSYLTGFIEDVLEFCLLDYDGTIVLIGTPGPILAGVFYDAYMGNGMMGGYSKHHWTLVDNPHIKLKSGKDPEQILAEIRERRGIDETNPTYMRESLGLWIEDTDSLVYQFSQSNGYYDQLPSGHKWEYIVGVDVGYEDADAIAILAFSRTLPTVYLIKEDISKKQLLEDLATKLVAIREKYNPVAMVGDFGALGKKLFESINARHHVNVKPAEKVRKFEYIALMNDDLRTQRILVPRGCRVVEDWQKIQWHPDMEPAKPRISNTFHSDIADAVLYGWREAKHYTYEEPAAKPKPGSAAFMKQQEDEMLDMAIKKYEKAKSDEEFGAYVDPEDYDTYY